MPRASTTSDAFNAVAEPRRREIIQLLADGADHAVGDLVTSMRLPQPAVSKHLRVLRQVGIVTAIRDGQHRRYRLQPRKLKPVHDWVKFFEKYWTEHLETIKEIAERKARERNNKPNP